VSFGERDGWIRLRNVRWAFSRLVLRAGRSLRPWGATLWVVILPWRVGSDKKNPRILRRSEQRQDRPSGHHILALKQHGPSHGVQTSGRISPNSRGSWRQVAPASMER